MPYSLKPPAGLRQRITRFPNAAYGLASMVLVAVLLVGTTELRISERSALEQREVQTSADNAAVSLGAELRALERAIALFARAEAPLLEQLARQPQRESVHDRLLDRVRAVFPDAFAVTLADPAGRLVREDIEGLVGEVCQRDIETYARTRTNPVYLHPNPYVYHFDVMTPVTIGGAPNWVFFVSFQADSLSRVLANSKVYGWQLLLVRTDIPDLIEISGAGSRQNLAREFRLSAAETGQIRYRTAVPGTRWEVVVLPDPGEHRDFAASSWRQTAAILAGLLLIGALLLRKVLATERHAYEQGQRLALNERAVRELYRISASPGHDFDARVQALLELGVRRFGLTTGILARVESGRYHVVAVHPADAGIVAGAEFALESTYCRDTLRSDQPVAIDHAAASPWNGHRCHREFGLNAYIGARLEVGGQLFGTLSFSSREPRALPFSDADRDFLLLMTQWLGAALEQREREREIREGQERLQLAVEGSGLALWDWNVATGEVYLSEQWPVLLGEAPRPVRTSFQALAELVHPDDRAAQAARIRAVLKGEVALYRAEHRVRTAAGEWKWIQSQGKVVERNAAGRAVRMTGTNADITERRRIQAELHASNALQRAILDSANYTIISTDPDGIIRTFNATAERLLGYRAEELVGRLTPAILHDAAEVAARAAELTRELGQTIMPGFEVFVARARRGEVDEREWTYIRRDRTRFPVQLSVTALHDEQGRISGFLGVGVDLTARKRDAEQLARSHRLLSAISAAQTRFIAAGDVPGVFDGLLTELLGITASEYGFIGEVRYDDAGRPYLKTHAITNIAWDEASRRFYDEHAPTGMEFRNLDTLFGAALTSGQPVIANAPAVDRRRGGLPPGHPPLRAFLGVPFHLGDKLVGMVGIANRPDGYDEPLVEFLQPLFATCAQVIEALRNDQRRRDAEARQRASSSRMQAILDTVVDGIITINERGVVESFNRAAEQIFGYPAERVIGNNVSMLMPEPFGSQHDQYLAHYLETGERRIIGVGREVTGRRADGSTFPIELSVSETWLGERRLFTGVVRDITERKKVERLKNEFVSTVSHELRTPLTSIRGSLGLVAGGVAGALPERARELLDIAYKNSERLTNLINDILDIERIESGRMKFELRRHPLMPLIEQAIEANRGYANSYGVGYRLAAGLPGVEVLVDSERFMQVLANLLSNAAKFSPAGSEVEVSAAVRGKRARIAVRDRGPGIPYEFRTRIFQKFSQADASDTRAKGGSGLGLSISKAIVERMGGSIGFDSTPGQGSTFWFDLPIAVDEAVLAAGGPAGGPAVLVCEDDPDVARVVAAILVQGGYRVDVAHDAAAARARLAERPYAAMTLDLGLPDEDGRALVAALRAEPRTRDLPVVVVSGRAHDGHMELSGGYAVVDWLTKPVEAGRLLAAVETATRGVNGERVRVLHVEDDPDIRRVVASLGGAVADFDHAATLEEAGAMLAGRRYHLVVLDLGLPDGSGWQLLPLIRAQRPPPPVLLFSAADVSAREAAEVEAVLVKSQTSNEELLATLRALIRGKA